MTVTRYDPQIIRNLALNIYNLDIKIEKSLIDFKAKISKEILQKDTQNEDSNKNDKKWRTITETPTMRPNIIKKTLKPENQMYLQLNKLSDSNLEAVSFLIGNIIEKSVDKDYIIEKLIIRLFQCAKIQIHFCHLYARLFFLLISKNPNLYKKNLEFKIKLEFENIKKMGFTNDESTYDEFCDLVKLKDNYMGCYQFCVELYNNNVLSYDNITHITGNILVDLDTLTDKTKLEIIIDALCRILKTIYKCNRFSVQEKNIIVTNIKETFKRNKSKLKPRSRFIFEDILEQANK